MRRNREKKYVHDPDEYFRETADTCQYRGETAYEQSIPPRRDYAFPNQRPQEAFGACNSFIHALFRDTFSACETLLPVI